MAEVEQLSFSYQEVVTALLKERGIHEGNWAIVINFSFGAANIGETGETLSPAAIVPVQSIGIARVSQATNLSVDAAVANPVSAPKAKKG